MVTPSLADRARVAAASASAQTADRDQRVGGAGAAARTDLRGALATGSGTHCGSGKLSVMELDGNGRPITVP
jgi:hypothetical protein